MNAAEAFVTKWMERHCPKFLEQFAAPPTFVTLSASGTIDKTTLVFMRSSYSSWEDMPEYSKILAACSDEGRKVLKSMLDARTWSAFNVGKNYVFGPAAAVKAIRSNNADTGSLYARWQTVNAKFPMSMEDRLELDAISNGTTDANNSHKTPSEIMGLGAFKSFVEVMAKVGITDIQGPFRVSESAASHAAWTECLAAAGPDRIPVTLRMNDTMEGYNQKYFWTVPRIDDSTAVFALMRFSAPTTYDAYGARYAPYYTADVSKLGDKWTLANDAIARLNAKYASSDVYTSAQLLKIDDYYLPMFVLPGKHELLFRSPWGTTDIVTSTSQKTFTSVSVSCTAPDVVGAMPIQWYVDYCNEQVAKGAKNSEALAKAATDLQIYLDKALTFISYAEPVMLEKDLVTLTQLYRDYEKAKKKACEDNDFMDQQFTADMKYGTLNTLINGSRNTGTFYGYRDASSLESLEETIVKSMVGWTMTGGSATVQVRKKDGTYAPSYTKDNGDEFLQAIAAGASLTGCTVSEQLAIWGFDPAVVTAQTEGLNSAYSNMNGSLDKGSPSAFYDFRWESIGITGFPDIKAMTIDEAYRCAMVSKGAVNALGAKLRDILLSEGRSFYLDSATYQDASKVVVS